MRSFQCTKCGREVESAPEAACAPDVLARENVPYCCGSPMMELMDD
ncbi:MAG: hypothetical protein ACE5G7_00030 [Candidatus Hydrothermarchaeaceae archaeon]